MFGDKLWIILQSSYISNIIGDERILEI